MNIGIFDSGIGGVSVLHEALLKLPNEQYIFYADTDHVPYGLKTHEQILEYADHIVSDLISRGVDAVVIACNTATSVAASHLRSKYSIPIIGMEPAVKPAIEHTRDDASSRVLVMATPVTIRENKLHDLLERVDTYHKADLLPMPELVTFAEAEKFETDEVYEYLERQFEPFDTSKYSALVLGCTHFNYFRPAYRRFFSDKTDILDGNAGTIRHLASLLKLELQDVESGKNRLNYKTVEEMKRDDVTYLTSGRTSDDAMLEHIYNLHCRLDAIT